REPRSGVLIAQRPGGGWAHGPFRRDHGGRIWEAPAPADGNRAETHAPGRGSSLAGTRHSTTHALRDSRCQPDYSLSSRIHIRPFRGWREIRGQVELFAGRPPDGYRRRSETDD